MTDQPTPRLVWLEIPVTDMDRAKAFYQTALDAPVKDDNNGPNPMAMLPYRGDEGPAGHLYPGKPAQNGEGVTPHLAVEDPLEDVMARVKDGGGAIASPIITVSDMAFFYAIDTEGNSVAFYKV